MISKRVLMAAGKNPPSASTMEVKNERALLKNNTFDFRDLMNLREFAQLIRAKIEKWIGS